MDYLISEGYPRAAEKFAKEANMQLPVDEESIQYRVEIRKAIHAGDIDTAVNKINDLNPQVSSTLGLATFLVMIIHCSCTTHSLRAEMITKPSVLSMNSSTSSPLLCTRCHEPSLTCKLRFSTLTPLSTSRSSVCN
jgi:hypothetical protein